MLPKQPKKKTAPAWAVKGKQKGAPEGAQFAVLSEGAGVRVLQERQLRSRHSLDEHLPPQTDDAADGR